MFGDSKAISTRKCFFVPIKWVWGLFVRQRQQYNRRRHRRARCYIDSLCGFLMRENEWRAKKSHVRVWKIRKRQTLWRHFVLCVCLVFKVERLRHTALWFDAYYEYIRQTARYVGNSFALPNTIVNIAASICTSFARHRCMLLYKFVLNPEATYLGGVAEKLTVSKPP